MRWVSGCVCVCVLLWSAAGQEKPLSQAELAKLPMWQRMLKGEDLKKVAELKQNYDKAMEAVDWAEAKKQAETLIEFRAVRQGADHWELTDAKVILKRHQRLMQLSAEQH